jgi:molybdenum cofactor cytidylyltransferase
VTGEGARALVLAAGLGRRFGGGKLHALYRGKPLLSYVLGIVGAARQRGLIDGGHVVIGAEDERAAALTRAAALDSVINDAPELGFSHSLKLGLDAVQASAGARAALIFLGDQPLVRLDVIEAVIGRWREGGGDIIRPRYQARPDGPGHPALLTRAVWQARGRLQGDQGFSAVLGTSSFETVTLDVPGDNPDIDTMADLVGLEGSS